MAAVVLGAAAGFMALAGVLVAVVELDFPIGRVCARARRRVKLQSVVNFQKRAPGKEPVNRAVHDRNVSMKSLCAA